MKVLLIIIGIIVGYFLSIGIAASIIKNFESVLDKLIDLFICHSTKYQLRVVKGFLILIAPITIIISILFGITYLAYQFFNYLFEDSHFAQKK